MRGSIMTAALVSLAVAGCASTSFEPITIQSTPPGALIGLDCGVDIPSDLKTPATIRVRTNAYPCVITLTMEGYETKTVALLRHVVPDAIEASGEDTSLGFVDYKSEIITRTLWMLFHLEDGRVWTHTPREIDVELKPIEAADHGDRAVCPDPARNGSADPPQDRSIGYDTYLGRRGIGYTALMDLRRDEIDEMLRRSAEIRTKLRRATRELSRFGERILAARAPNEEQGDKHRSSDDDRSR